jgi:hypothetical protein
MDLSGASDLLYGLVPSEFVPRREALVRELRASGDTGLAAEVGRLRKPTAGAWLGNLLARVEPDQLAALVDLGTLLRDAQNALDGAQLRGLGRQRGQLVSALAALARRHAAELGHPVGESALREVESTLTAALSDPAAAELLLGGALTSALEYVGTGFGPGGAAGDGPVVRERRGAAPRPTPLGRPTPPHTVAPHTVALHAVRTGPDDAGLAAAEQLDHCERALAQARLHAAEAVERALAASQEQQQAEAAVAATAALQERLARQMADLLAAQDAAHEDGRQARTRLDTALRAARAADRGVDQAQARVTDAEAALDNLREG